MKSVKELITLMKDEWSAAHYNNPEKDGFELACIFKRGTNISQNLTPNDDFPSDIIDFWSISNGAELFKDITYSQWGLEIFSIEDAITKTQINKDLRPKQYIDSDFIIGSFLGDSDLLIVSCDRKSDKYGNVIVSVALEARKDWYFVANSFHEFLNEYVYYQGDKFWEATYKKNNGF